MPEIDTAAIGSSFDGFLGSGWDNILKTVLVALVLLIVCAIVRSVLLKVLDKGLNKSSIEVSFHRFIHSAVSVLLWFVTILIVAQSLGINTSSLLALLGIAGLAVSLSVQDSLSNLAGGITILGTKPFKVGDYVEIGGTGGVVKEIGMIHTKLDTLDNVRIVLPNSSVISAQVNNYSAEDLRRVDIVVHAANTAPVEKVKEVLMGVVSSHEKVLSDPAPFARMSGYGDGCTDYTVRGWVENGDYWPVYHDLLEQTKIAMGEAGYAPFPKMEVQVRQAQ